MDKKILFLIMLILLSSFVFAEREAENDKFILSCDKETYFVITGDSYAYCSITNKEQGKYTTDIYAILKQATGVEINQIDIDNEGMWIPIGTSDYEDVRTFKGKKTSSKVQINGESTIDIRIKLGVTNLGVKDEFWLGVDDFELDPAVVGCDIETDPTVYSCNDSTFTGNGINTNLNIRIYNATITATGGDKGLNITSTAGWIQINQSTLNANAVVNRPTTITAEEYVIINGSIINSEDTYDGTSASSGDLNITSYTSDINIYGSTLNNFGSSVSDCGGDSSNSFAGGASYLNINTPNNLVINDTTINSYGGNGKSCGGDGTSARGGTTFIKMYADNIKLLTSTSRTLDFRGGDPMNSNGYDGSANCLFNSSTMEIKGYNQSILTINCNDGTGGATAGTSKTEFKIGTELRLDNNVTIQTTSSPIAQNWSKINFTGSDNLKMMFSGVSIPNQKLFVFCDNKQSDKNLYTTWENFLGKTQYIDFQYCQNINITREEYLTVDFYTSPPAPTFVSPTPTNSQDILNPITTINISANSGMKYYLEFGNTSSLGSSYLVMDNFTETGGGYKLFYTNSSLLSTNGVYYYRARVQNASDGEFSLWSETRNFGYYQSSLLVNCSGSNASLTKVMTIYGKDEETDAAVTLELDITLGYYYINTSFTNESAFSLRNQNNYSFCMSVNSSFTLNGLAEFGDGVTYTKRKYYFAGVDVNTTTSSDIYLYHLNNSKASEITFTVFDTTTGNKVDGAYIKILRYYPGENVYRLVEVSKTDETGESLGKMVLADVFYKFLIEIPIGTVKLDTGVLRILSLTRSFGISFVENYLDTWNKIHDVSYSTTCTKSTQTCRVTWSDSSNTVKSVTLEIWRTNGITDELLSTQTTEAAAGTISYTIVEATDGNDYTAKAFAKSNPDWSFGYASLPFPDSPFFTNETHRLASLFPLFLLVIVIVFALIDWGAIGITIGSLLGLIIGSVTGILPIDIYYLISFILLAVILIYKLSK